MSDNLTSIRRRLGRVELGLAVLTAIAVTQHPILVHFALKWWPAMFAFAHSVSQRLG